MGSTGMLEVHNNGPEPLRLWAQGDAGWATCR